jgi:hypothetical protein
MKAVVRRWFGDVDAFEGAELPRAGQLMTLSSGARMLVERCDFDGAQRVILVRPPVGAAAF